MGSHEQCLRDALNSFDEPLFILDGSGGLAFASTSFLSLVGWDATELETTTYFWPDFKESLLQERECVSEFVCKGGERLAARLFYQSFGECSYLIRVVGTHSEDISLQSFQNQRLETLGMLAGGIAHDFNNILAGILGHITYLKTILPGSGDHFESLQAIEDGARKASGMTQQILDFSRLDAEERPQKIDLCELVESTCRLLKGAISPEFRIEVQRPDTQVTVLAVEARLTQVLANLVVNARDACEADRTIYVRVISVEANQEVQNIFQCEELSASTYAVLEVEDRGIGIAPELRERVFDAYFTTKSDQGTGLGLATVNAIVRAFGGAILLDSEVGVGTRVAVYLPVLEVENVRMASSGLNLPEDLERGTERILVVDDEHPVRNVLTMSLEHLGYRVETAASGMEAIDKFRTGVGKIDLVILDMLMPRLPGEEVFDVLKELDPDIRVLVISGFSSAEAVQKILDNGGLGFIQKPFTIDQLSRKVRECFQHSK